MKPLPPLTFPPGLDLGPIDSVQIGDEIACWHTHEGLKLSSKVGRVTEVNERLVRVGKSSHWLRVNRGAALYFMADGWYYHSANPEHIARAKEQAKRELQAEQEKRAAFERQMVLSRPIGELLGDGEVYDQYNECHHSESIAEELAKRLTAEQLKTLAEWLKIGA